MAMLIIAVPFLIFAGVLSTGRGAFLLAGYNTMTENEKAEYDEAALCKFMGKVMYAISASLVLMGIGEWLDRKALVISGIALFAGALLFALVYANASDRFKKK